MSRRTGKSYRRQLHSLLDRHFDREELRLLCFELGIDYDNLRGETKAAVAMELVRRLEREERLVELANLIHQKRPQLTIPTLIEDGPLRSPGIGIWIAALAGVLFLIAVAIVTIILWPDGEPEEAVTKSPEAAEEEVVESPAEVTADTPVPPAATDTPTPPTPTPIYSEGLITYIEDGDDGQRLHAIQPDGADVVLYEGATSLMVVAISPDRRHLVLAAGRSAEIGLAASTPRWVASELFDEAAVELWAIDVADLETTSLLESPACFANAEYTAGGDLVVAAVEEGSEEIVYRLAEGDGTNMRTIYRSTLGEGFCLSPEDEA